MIIIRAIIITHPNALLSMGRAKAKEKVKAKATDIKKEAKAKGEKAKAAGKAEKATHTMVGAAVPLMAKLATIAAPPIISLQTAPYKNNITRTSTISKPPPSTQIIPRTSKSQRK